MVIFLPFSLFPESVINSSFVIKSILRGIINLKLPFSPLSHSRFPFCFHSDAEQIETMFERKFTSTDAERRWGAKERKRRKNCFYEQMNTRHEKNAES